MTEERVGTRSKTRSRLETLMDIIASVEDHPVKGITQIISEQNAEYESRVHDRWQKLLVRHERGY